MTTSRMIRAAAVALAMAFVGDTWWGPVTGVAQGQNAPRPVVSFATRTDTSGPVRDLPSLPPTPPVLGQIFERPFNLLPNRQGSPEVDTFDGAAQGPIAVLGAPSVAGNFEGVGNQNSVLPPDPTGDIGPNHYVQMVNLSFAIFDRNGNTLYGPADNKTLWAGFGGPCETRNDGDPIVLYDHLADRWMMSQFALPNFPKGPFYQCIAVSQTPDPTGAWHRYEFTIHQSKLNDYPKFGVWPDGYYMAINQFSCNFVRCRWAGQGVVAFERAAMLTGAAARMVYFDLESVNSNLGGMLPADLDGSATPPAGAPNPFAQIDDDAWGYSPDQLQLWQFAVDWANPTASTFTHTVDLPTASFNSNMCGYSRNCIPQPGGTNVDAISDRLMYRLQYRNFGSYEALLTNHTVDENGSDHAAVRWYELRNSGLGWNIYQQGTYAPDAHHRWMGSIAMNGIGDVALGYSLSSTSVSPSVAVTGRRNSDAAGFMQAEVVLANGSGYQTHSSGRWGDYSQMSVDPLDDCTFWYTQEYYATVGPAPWQTRIGAFKLGDCGPTAPAAPTNLTATAGDSQVALSWTGSSGAESYTVNRGTSSSNYTTFFSGITTTSYTDTTAVNGTTYYYVVTAVNTVGGSGPSNEVSATPAAPTAPNPPSGLTAAAGDNQVALSWTGSSGAESYTVNRGTSSGNYTTFFSGITTTSYTDTTAVNGTTYYYVVTAVNTVGGSGPSNEVSATPAAAPVGVTVTSISPSSVSQNAGIRDFTITGTGLAAGASVAFENGEGPAPRVNSVTFIDSATLSANVEIRSGGPPRNRYWDVRVTNPNGSTGVGVDLLEITP